MAQQFVPQPREVTPNSLHYMLPNSVDVSAPRGAEELIPFAREIVANHHLPGAKIAIALQTNDAALGAEGYRLHVGPEGISVAANADAGAFYALQTLDEYLPYGNDAASVPGVDVRDWPAYRWRGIHLDVSRHFFPVSVVKRYIDVAAHFKLNVFHWHLTDDQGWRIEIRRYPRLATVGGCRAGSEQNGDATEIDAVRYCGYYTQAQIRDVVAYARARFVTIVPEIEMPGHSQAALAAYPALACTPGPFAVRETWGVSDEIYCPTEYTFAFLENVLREVIALFPGRYVHVGGDEVPKTAWQHSKAVHALMKRERITTYDGVQGYFDRRIERFLESQGRTMIGWDEILDGGVSIQAAVMAWQGEARGTTSAMRGNQTVMTPNGPLYFDAYQGDPNDEPQAIGNLSTPQDVYEFEPLPAALTPAQAKHVLGVQGNLWSEYVATQEYLFYMLLPRMLSLSEIAWSDPHPRSWSTFEARMGAQLPWLTAHGYNYRIPNPEFGLGDGALRFANVAPSVRTIRAQTSASTVAVTISSVVPNATIHYTTDGSAPSAKSPAYETPLSLTFAPAQRIDVRAIVVTAEGRSSTPSELILEQAGERL